MTTVVEVLALQPSETALTPEDDEVLTIIGFSHPFAGLAEQMLDAGWSRDMVVWVLDRLEAERAALVGEPRLGLSKQGATAPVVVPLVPVPDDPGPEP